jgi:NRPS condensation-like uncharacterized protein
MLRVLIAVRIPLNPIDQLIFHVDRDETPWSCHFEVRVSGRLDDDRLAVAATTAAGRHPIVGARLAPYRARDRQLYWDTVDPVDSVRIEVVECPDDDAVAEARMRLLNRRIHLDIDPPLALMLAHRPGGDSLILNLNHAAGDGTSGVLLLAAIARAYAGADEGPPAAGPTEVRDLRAEIAWRPKHRVKQEKRPGPTARVAVDGGRRDTTGSGLCQLRFEASLTEEILARRREEATLNDVLVGSLAVAIRRFNDERDVPPAALSLVMPLDMRAPGRAEEIVSNISFPVSLPVLADEQSDLTSAQLAVAERTQVIKARRQAGQLMDLPPMVGGVPVGILHFALPRLARLGQRLLASRAEAAVFTNMGRVGTPLDFGVAAGPTTELWLSPPVQMPPGIAIAAATINGELFVALRYSHQQFDSAGAARFADAWRGVLLDG